MTCWTWFCCAAHGQRAASFAGASGPSLCTVGFSFNRLTQTMPGTNSLTIGSKKVDISFIQCSHRLVFHMLLQRWLHQGDRPSIPWTRQIPLGKCHRQVEPDPALCNPGQARKKSDQGFIATGCTVDSDATQCRQVVEKRQTAYQIHLKEEISRWWCNWIGWKFHLKNCICHRLEKRCW